jgi:tRNA(Ile2) C34 agmatinyltransferase TiaS
MKNKKVRGIVKCPKCGDSGRVISVGPSHFQCKGCKLSRVVNGNPQTVPFNFRTPEENKA